MKRLITTTFTVLSLAVLLLFSACGGSGGGPTPGPNPTPFPTPTPVTVITITTNPLQFPDGVEESPYSVAFTASGGRAPYTWLVDRLPNGLSMDSSTGTISGTLARGSAGRYSLYVRAVDANGAVGVASPYIVVNSKLALNPITGAHTNVEYRQGIVPVGSYYNGNVNVTFVSGSLPAGISFAPGTSAVLSGTTTVAGTYNFRVHAEVSSNPPQSLDQDFTLVVDDALWIMTTSVKSAIQNSPYTSDPISVVNGLAPLSFTSADLPAGLLIDNASGVISGSPSVAGTRTFSIQVTDSSTPSKSATGQISMTIGEALRINTYRSMAASELRSTPACGLSAVCHPTLDGLSPELCRMASHSTPETHSTCQASWAHPPAMETTIWFLR